MQYGYDYVTIDKTGGVNALVNPISIEAFADGVMKNNPGEYERDSLIAALRAAAEAKKNGACCIICGEPIWAAGSAITGTNLCFACTTGEADDSEDYEIL